MELFSASLNSPLGPIVLKATQTDLVELNFEAINPRGLHSNSLLEEATAQLQAYFAGKLQSFSIPIKPEGTPFERDIWKRLQEIPFATTLSYTDFSIHHPKAIRAIASANGKNKIPILIPCHRVIGKNGNLVGYSGGIWRKKWLLDHENEIAPKGQTRLKL
ncbi:MAG: methylated-DNA--[protein]-cysteine S-methyltransferase [Pedobacter sp.]|nr:MAG: methylated-DNA--[protein]-cysteine S-methyltransferase [Pedobacter sp.]